MGRIICVGGVARTGKSTLAEKLADYYGVRCVGAGDIFRELGGVENVDDLLDERFNEEMVRGNVVLEGRASGYLARVAGVYSYNILLKCSKDKRKIMSRVAGDKVDLSIRGLKEEKRLFGRYGVNIFDEKYYDLIVDSSALDADKVFQKAKEYLATASCCSC